MFRDYFRKTGCAMAALLLLPAMTLAATSRMESSTNVSNEATVFLNNIQVNASNAASQAMTLQSNLRFNYVTWQTDAAELSTLKHEVNNIGQEIHSLSLVRKSLQPWQRAAMVRSVRLERLLADNTGDAIVYLQNHEHSLWNAPYNKYVKNVVSEASQLSSTVKQYKEFAKVQREDTHFQKVLGMRQAS